MSLALRSPTPTLPSRAATSQQSLAQSIAREVRSRLPGSGSMPDLGASVEASVREQAVRNELWLAYVRAGAATMIAVVALVGWLQPRLVGARAVPGVVVGIIAIGALGAIGLLWALRRGWYHYRVRQLVPAADALLISLPVVFAADGATGDATASVPGMAALAAIACALLVFSGAVRLSRSAQRVATSLGAASWLFVSFLLGIPLLVALFSAGVLVVIGGVGTRFSSMVRSAVANRIAGESLERMYREARAAIDAREEVLSTVAHDLRNPLSTIGMTASMLRDMPVEPDKAARYLGTIIRCKDSMNRIIQDLLDVARMEAGRLEVVPRDVEVDELLSSVTDLMEPIAREHQLRLECGNCEAALRTRVDPDRILQVFSNLVGNAIKFTPAGGLIEVRAQRIGDRVRFSVIDAGPGVPPDRVERLFERFWQANGADRRGIGLGLAIARSIVEAHEGRIGVESRTGGGSEFWFTTPLVPGP